MMAEAKGKLSGRPASHPEAVLPTATLSSLRAIAVGEQPMLVG
jgi:hypothetical protein